MAEPASKRSRTADGSAARADDRRSYDHHSRARPERDDSDRNGASQRRRDPDRERERERRHDSEQDRKYRDRSDHGHGHGNRYREYETDGRGRFDDARERGERNGGHRREERSRDAPHSRRRGEDKATRHETDGRRERRQAREESVEKRRSRSPGREEEVSRSRRPHTSSRDTLDDDTKAAVQRTLTPPVQFHIRPGSSDGHSKDRSGSDSMDVDASVKRNGDRRKEQSKSNRIHTKRDMGKSEEGRVGSDDDDEDVVVADEDDAMMGMQAMMGFGGFGTTKQKKVAGNDVSAVRKEKKTEYRQYMNRVGGFNRPLSPSRD